MKTLKGINTDTNPKDINISHARYLPNVDIKRGSVELTESSIFNNYIDEIEDSFITGDYEYMYKVIAKIAQDQELSRCETNKLLKEAVGNLTKSPFVNL